MNNNSSGVKAHKVYGKLGRRQRAKERLEVQLEVCNNRLKNLLNDVKLKKLKNDDNIIKYVKAQTDYVNSQIAILKSRI